METINLNFLGLFTLIAGFIIGLGAVTVIDLHGFLGRRSEYWTLATTRTHKITKPLIWIGTLLAFIGGVIFYSSTGIENFVCLHFLVLGVMVFNGIFLTFSVSPFLLQREGEGKAAEILPKSWQVKISFSFVVSFVCWWGSLALVVYNIVHNF